VTGHRPARFVAWPDRAVPGRRSHPPARLRSSERVVDWFARRTWQPAPWTAAELVTAKAGRTISVVLPALDEEATVADVVAAVAVHGPGGASETHGVPLVDEIVVLDGGSRDRTAERARAAGARVVDRESALPGVPVRPGKGEVLWRSLAATSGDIVVFVDADLVEVDPRLVVALLGPMLTVAGVELTKGFYHRPLRTGGEAANTGGGRVTELMARPLLARFAPDLSGVVQPLGGEYAATRDLLESLPFAGGYGVEVGLLLDTLAARGLDAIAQVDLGIRKHRNRDLLELGVMAQHVLATVLARVGVDQEVVPVELVQYVHGAGAGSQDAVGRLEWRPAVSRVDPSDRPPMAGLLTSRRELSGGRGTIGV